MQSMIQLATAFFKMAESLAKPHTVPQLPRGVVQLRCTRPQTVVTKPCRHGSCEIHYSCNLQRSFFFSAFFLLVQVFPRAFSFVARRMGPPKQQAFPPTPVPPAPAPLAKKQVRKGRLKSPAALRNAAMERALRLQWSALLERERAMLIAGTYSPAHVSEQ